MVILPIEKDGVQCGDTTNLISWFCPQGRLVTIWGGSVNLDPAIRDLINAIEGLGKSTDPEVAASGGAGAARGGVAPVARGARGVAMAIAEAVARDETLLGTEIKLQSIDGVFSTNVDFITRTKQNIYRAYEVKASSQTRMSGPQQKAMISFASDGAVPLGRNAELAGFAPARLFNLSTSSRQ